MLIQENDPSVQMITVKRTPQYKKPNIIGMMDEEEQPHSI